MNIDREKYDKMPSDDNSSPENNLLRRRNMHSLEKQSLKDFNRSG